MQTNVEVNAAACKWLISRYANGNKILPDVSVTALAVTKIKNQLSYRSNLCISLDTVIVAF